MAKNTFLADIPLNGGMKKIGRETRRSPHQKIRLSLAVLMNSHLFPMNQSIEAIVAPGNLDEDCRRISELMAPVANAIDQDLIDGRSSEAVDLFLHLHDSLCYHFVADEHWRWFDDCYDPGLVVNGCWKRIRECLGWFLEEDVEMLRVGLGELSETEAYREYGYPGIGKWKVGVEGWKI